MEPAADRIRRGPLGPAHGFSLIEVLIVIAVGSEGDLSTLKENHQKVSVAPRTRNPLEENFFFNQFVEPDAC